MLDVHRCGGGGVVTTALPDDGTGLRELLFTGPGGDVLDAVYDEAIRLCALAGVVRADKVIAVAPGASSVIRVAAMDYLVEIDALREATPSGTVVRQRVFSLVE